MKEDEKGLEACILLYSESLALKNPRKKTRNLWDDNLKRSQTFKKLV